MQKPALRIYAALFLAAAIVLPITVLAETIRLKDGRQVEGEIVEKGADYVKVDIGGVTVTYFKDDLADNQASADSGQVNKGQGFRISAPKGWHKQVVPDKSALVVFVKDSADKNDIPRIGVTVDQAPPGINSALEFMKLVLPQYQKGIEKQGGIFRLISQPERILMPNGAEAAAVTFEMVNRRGPSLTSMDFKFMQADKVATIQCVDYSNAFKANFSDFSRAIESFEFVGVPGRKSGGIAEGARVRALNEIAASGKKQYSKYENKEPFFSLDIPKDMNGAWYFLVFNDSRAPFYVMEESGAGEGLPMITSMIDVLPADKLAKNKEELFEEVAMEHERWEKGMPAIASVNFIKKAPLDLNGPPAFERLVETAFKNGKKVRLHVVYIFLDKFLLQIGLNADSAAYAKDDADFMKIIKTLTVK